MEPGTNQINNENGVTLLAHFRLSPANIMNGKLEWEAGHRLNSFRHLAFGRGSNAVTWVADFGVRCGANGQTNLINGLATSMGE